MALKRDAATRKETLRVLELDENATKEDIRKAYTRLALRYHPDKNPDDPKATEKFQTMCKAYEALTKPKEVNKRSKGSHYCPHHGVFHEDSDDHDTDEDDSDDFYSTDDDLLEDLYERIFFEFLAKEIFKRRFCAKKKRKPATEEEQKEERFYEDLRKKYQHEESEDDFVLTEEDLKKFHSYEAWEEEMNQNRKKRRRRKGKKKAEKFPQTTAPTLNKKQLHAEQRKREREMKEIGEELAKKINTASEKKAASSTKTASHSCGFDADIMRNIVEQQREKQKKEEELAVKMREIDGQQKTQEKRKKRQEKKEKRKQQKLEPVSNVLSEEKPEEKVPPNPFEPINQKVTSRPKFKGLKSPTMRDRAVKSTVLHQYFTEPKTDLGGTTTRAPAAGPSLAPKPTKAKGDPALLQKHMQLYNEMMKVQPQRHTEQQLRQEREVDRRHQQQRHQDELNRLRNKNNVQVQSLPVRPGTAGGQQGAGLAHQNRQQLLQRQRDMERRRNEEEDSTYSYTSMKPKQSAPKWYEKPAPGVVGYHTMLSGAPPAVTKENIWEKRQVEQEQKEERLRELVPDSQLDEQRMLELALRQSQETARLEEETRAIHKEQRRSRFAAARQEMEATKQSPPDPPSYTPSYVPSYSSKVASSQPKPWPQQNVEVKPEPAPVPRQKTLSEACREKEWKQYMEKQAANNWGKEQSEDWESIWDGKPAQQPAETPASKPVPQNIVKFHPPGSQHAPSSRPGTQSSANNYKQPVPAYSDPGKSRSNQVRDRYLAKEAEERRETGMWAQKQGTDNWEDEVENSWLYKTQQNADSSTGKTSNAQNSWKCISSNASESSSYTSSNSMDVDDWANDIKTVKPTATHSTFMERETVEPSLPVGQNSARPMARNDLYGNMAKVQDDRGHNMSKIQVPEVCSIDKSVYSANDKIQDCRYESTIRQSDENIKEVKSEHHPHETVPGYSKAARSPVEDPNLPSQRLPALADLTKLTNASLNNISDSKTIHEDANMPACVKEERAETVIPSVPSESPTERRASPVADLKPETVAGVQAQVGQGGAAAPLGPYPFGLPGHLQQAYLQYLQQSTAMVPGGFPQFGMLNPMLNPFAMPWMFANQQLRTMNQTALPSGLGMVNQSMAQLGAGILNQSTLFGAASTNQVPVQSGLGGMNTAAAPAPTNSSGVDQARVDQGKMTAERSVQQQKEQAGQGEGQHASVLQQQQSTQPGDHMAMNDETLRLPRAPSMSIGLPNAKPDVQKSMSDNKDNLIQDKARYEQGGEIAKSNEQLSAGRRVFEDLTEKQTNCGWMSNADNIKVNVKFEGANPAEIENSPGCLPTQKTNCYVPPHKRPGSHVDNGAAGDNWRIKNNSSPHAFQQTDTVKDSNWDEARQGSGDAGTGRSGFGMPDRRRNWNTAGVNESGGDQTQNSGRSVGKGLWKPREVRQSAADTATNQGDAPGGVQRSFGGNRNLNEQKENWNAHESNGNIQARGGFGRPQVDYGNEQKENWNGQESNNNMQPRGGFGRARVNEGTNSSEARQNSSSRVFSKPPRFRKPDSDFANQSGEENINRPQRGGFGLPGRRIRNPMQNAVDSSSRNDMQNTVNSCARNGMQNTVNNSARNGMPENNFNRPQTPRRGGFGVPPQKGTTPEHTYSTSANRPSENWNANQNINASSGQDRWKAEPRQQYNLSDRFASLSVDHGGSVAQQGGMMGKENGGMVAQQRGSSLRMRKERSQAIMDMLNGMNNGQQDTQQTSEHLEQRSY